MTDYDYAVLVFYFAFMLAIGWVFRRFATNVSEYFRGGGRALWWMVGGSAFMVSFSAWTFTGAAGQAYREGWPIVLIYLGNIAGFLLNAWRFGPRFRQLRVVTGVEAIRLRFGRASEQFFTWLQIPVGTLQAAVWLNAIGVFFAAVFDLDMGLTITVTGLVVLLIALLGGSWAVLASDFIQVLILLPVCLAVTVLAVRSVGGLGPVLDGLPAGHLDLARLSRDGFLGWWGLAMVLKQINSTNNLMDANRYLCAKDGRHARRAGLFGAALFVVGIPAWFLPPMIARLRFPDLAAQWPALGNPDEAAYIAIAQAVMPAGMMGLLVSGIFAATMSSMDAGLNKNAGIFVRNFYHPFVRPGAADAELLRAGKLATVLLGLAVILVAHRLSELRGLGLFLLMQRVTILVAVPVMVPLLLGLLIRRTPPWSGWSTVLVGLLGSLFIGDLLPPERLAAWWGVAPPDGAAEREYWVQAVQMLGNVALGTAWFAGTRLAWRRAGAAWHAANAEFFTRLETPVDFAREEGEGNDARQSRAVGRLCAVYGVFVLLLALIPNPVAGRLAFVGCGAVVLAVGVLLMRAGRSVVHSGH